MSIKDEHIDDLKAACAALGLEFRENQKRFAWYGRFMNDSSSYGEMTPEKMGHCEHAIRIPGTNPRDGSSGPWEIGVFRKNDGSLGIAYDEWGGAGRQLTEKVGRDAALLKHQYSVEVAERKALQDLSRHGWRAVRQTHKDDASIPVGRTRIKLRKR